VLLFRDIALAVAGRPKKLSISSMSMINQLQHIKHRQKFSHVEKTANQLHISFETSQMVNQGHLFLGSVKSNVNIL